MHTLAYSEIRRTNHRARGLPERSEEAFKGSIQKSLSLLP
jgi:hypothetical protein